MQVKSLHFSISDVCLQEFVKLLQIKFLNLKLSDVTNFRALCGACGFVKSSEVKSGLAPPYPGKKSRVLIAEHLSLFGIAKNDSKDISTQRPRRSIGLAVHRGWAELLFGRSRDLAEDPRQPHNHTRETDEGDAETHEYFHLHHTYGAGAATAAPARARELSGYTLGSQGL